MLPNFLHWVILIVAMQGKGIRPCIKSRTNFFWGGYWGASCNRPPLPHSAGYIRLEGARQDGAQVAHKQRFWCIKLALTNLLKPCSMAHVKPQQIFRYRLQPQRPGIIQYLSELPAYRCTTFTFQASVLFNLNNFRVVVQAPPRRKPTRATISSHILLISGTTNHLSAESFS